MGVPSIDEAVSPQAVFAFAQSAIAAGDWESLFACLDVADVRRIASVVMPLTCLSNADEFVELCVSHGVGPATIDDLRAAHTEIAASAAAIVNPTASSPQDRSSASLRHRDLVRSYDALVAGAVEEIADLPGFVAAAERFRRSTEGGGSVSSSLFHDEVLVDVVVSGKKATGLRRRPEGGDERMGFVRGRQGWRIRLFAGRAR